jgi:predicted solute-binding protein
LNLIAEREAPILGIPEELALGYLRENLHFALGKEEAACLRRFYELCVKHELAPAGVHLPAYVSRSGETVRR